MTKEFIPYEQALELKELGFDEPCFGFFNYKGEIRRYTNFDGELNDFQTLKNSDITLGELSFCTAPTYSQAFRWFREKYPDFDFGVGKIYNGSNTYHYHINLIWEYFEGTYEEAELACLIKLIEICKNK